MSEKPTSERLGILETKLEDHHERIQALENINHEVGKHFLSAGWFMVKLLLLGGLLALVTEKTREKILSLLSL